MAVEVRSVCVPTESFIATLRTIWLVPEAASQANTAVAPFVDGDDDLSDGRGRPF